MRLSRRQWTFVALFISLGLAWYVGHSLGLEERAVWLASQPGVATAFQHPESGRTDALTTLIAFTVLTPIAAFVVVLVLILLAKLSEPAFESVHLPTWLSKPVVGMVSFAALYTTSESWLPP